MSVLANGGFRGTDGSETQSLSSCENQEQRHETELSDDDCFHS